MIEYWFCTKDGIRMTSDIMEIVTKDLHCCVGPAFKVFVNNKLINEEYFLDGFRWNKEEFDFIIENKLEEIPCTMWPEDFGTMFKMKFR